ncbi:hypothetical protein OPT61_g6074 [Boeremia exigua]|uniref:Uncharacterized protein n=1 Tax=Boeremia exigua TaxID=749465 RepID=A0ACC2I7Z9_9PLEO|nr:hypothetical protein OPT61_g6074 [Boeremia exigua]
MSTNNSWADYPWRNPAIVFEELPESLILEDLKRSWDFQREAHFRFMQKLIWTSIDSYRVVLRDVEGMVGDIAKDLCNKPTTFYWLQSAQTGAPDAPEMCCMSGGVFAAIYEEWHRSLVHPNIEFGHFFAAPVRIAGTGPTSLPQILKAHSSLCVQAQHISLDMDNYSVHPLLPAVIIVCDRRVEVDYGPDGYVSLREVGRKQTAPVILTGTNQTSTGIEVTLDSLEPFALPVERADAASLDIRRVPLDIAIKFVTELESRIDERKETSGRTVDTSLCHHQTPVGYNHDLAYDSNVWAQTMRAEALKIGFKKLDDTKFAAQCWKTNALAAGKRASDLAAIVRLTVVNEESKIAIWQASKLSSSSRMEDNNQVEYTRQDNGFYAILGAPNGASTMRMLRDHRTELGYRVVENIVVFGNKGLTMQAPETRSMPIILSTRRDPPSKKLGHRVVEKVVVFGGEGLSMDAP